MMKVRSVIERDLRNFLWSRFSGGDRRTDLAERPFQSIVQRGCPVGQFRAAREGGHEAAYLAIAVVEHRMRPADEQRADMDVQPVGDDGPATRNLADTATEAVMRRRVELAQPHLGGLQCQERRSRAGSLRYTHT